MLRGEEAEKEEKEKSEPWELLRTEQDKATKIQELNKIIAVKREERKKDRNIDIGDDLRELRTAQASITIEAFFKLEEKKDVEKKDAEEKDGLRERISTLGSIASMSPELHQKRLLCNYDLLLSSLEHKKNEAVLGYLHQMSALFEQAKEKIQGLMKEDFLTTLSTADEKTFEKIKSEWTVAAKEAEKKLNNLFNLWEKSLDSRWKKDLFPLAAIDKEFSKLDGNKQFEELLSRNGDTTEFYPVIVTLQKIMSPLTQLAESEKPTVAALEQAIDDLDSLAVQLGSSKNLVLAILKTAIQKQMPQAEERDALKELRSPDFVNYDEKQEQADREDYERKKQLGGAELGKEEKEKQQTLEQDVAAIIDDTFGEEAKVKEAVKNKEGVDKKAEEPHSTQSDQQTPRSADGNTAGVFRALSITKLPTHDLPAAELTEAASDLHSAISDTNSAATHSNTAQPTDSVAGSKMRKLS